MKKWLIAAAVLLLPALCHAKPVVGGPVSPLDNKTEVQVDLPVALRKHNCGGSDGAGLCVFTSIMHAARWASEHRLENFQDQMKKEPGGGYPEKVDKMIEKFGKGTPYVQYEGPDDSIIQAALKSGRLPGVTYNGHDPHYSGSISHMVNCVYDDGRQCAILDNNFIGENELVWMTHEEFVERWGGKHGWAVVLLAPPPPPPPKTVGDDEPGRRHHHPRPRPKPAGAVVDGGLLSWYAPPDHADQLWLYCGENQIGGYDLGRRRYFPRYGPGDWGGPTVPPVPLPADYMTDYGVSIPVGGEGYDLCGRKVGRAEAMRAVGADVPDDAGLPRLTIIGSEAETKPVLADLDANPALLPWKGKLVVKSYDPARPLDAPLLQCGLDASGKPTILLQAPDGRVLHHQKDYSDGASGLALALRKADPNYHPDADPDRRQTPALGEDLNLTPDEIGTGAVLAVLAGAALLFSRKGS